MKCSRQTVGVVWRCVRQMKCDEVTEAVKLKTPLRGNWGKNEAVRKKYRIKERRGKPGTPATKPCNAGLSEIREPQAVFGISGKCNGGILKKCRGYKGLRRFLPPLLANKQKSSFSGGRKEVYGGIQV